MKQPLLVLDVHYLCHRAFHAQGDLSWGVKPTGVIFGFLKGIKAFKEEFQTDRVAFCFEHPHLYRRDIYPEYKRKRAADRTPTEKKAYTALSIQINELHRRYLPRIGFKNIFAYDGMESDDIMAEIALSAKPDEDVILVTTDSDLWQCLRDNVRIYQPTKQRTLTRNWFLKTHGMEPSRWAVVKAIAGCNGDGVRGVEGVGEVTALRYLRGELKEDSVAHQKITSPASRFIVQRNRRLVQLPYAGCPKTRIVEDHVSVKGWEEVCAELGMKSLTGQPPML